MSLLIVGMDITIVNVALPAIQYDLHATIAGLQWILHAYNLVIASFLMLSGSMSDRFGRRRVFQIGLGLFTVASLLCRLARGIGELMAFRALQGLGASMLNPVASSILPCSINRTPSCKIFQGTRQSRWAIAQMAD
jgi:MFS family permease